MQGCKRIVQEAPNEFVMEFETQTIKEGQEFMYQKLKHKILRAYPGIVTPGCYTFLVITKIV